MQVPSCAVRDCPGEGQYASYQAVEHHSRQCVKNQQLNLRPGDFGPSAVHEWQFQLQEPRGVQEDILHVEEEDSKDDKDYRQQLVELAESNWLASSIRFSTEVHH